MSLILAIEPDRRQSAKVASLAEQLQVELVIGESADDALGALGSRVPDVVLTSQLLLPRDEAALAERLRELGAAGAHVQTLVIPVLRGDEKTRKKRSGGGLFGRLRRAAPDEGKSEDGCDPAVFAAEITEYLERGAAERAAVAAAQADLEAAWAEQPAPAPAGTPAAASTVEPATVASPPWYAAVDVHPDMVIDDPEALFGEFAAIPIRRAAADAPQDAADSGALAFALETPAVTPRRREEDWEEIPLDDDKLGQPAAWPTSSDAPPPPHNGVELTAESLDLDAFIGALGRVATSANPQPMIPIVDLSDVLAGDIDLPEPTIVEESELLEEARATFAAEITAAFTSEPVTDVSLDARDETTWAARPGADGTSIEDTTAVSAEPARDLAPAVPRVEWPEFAAPQPMPTLTWEERPQTDWRAAIDALPPPPSIVRPVDLEAAPAPPELKAGWQDMLSAIRRDIKSLKTDEAAALPTRPKPEFNAEPLVFPSRPAVAASVLSDFEAQAAQRSRESEDRARQADRLAGDAQDRGRAVEEALRAATAAVETSKIVEATAPLPIDSTTSIFDAKIDTDLTAVAFEPIVALQPASAEGAPRTFSPAIDQPVGAAGHDDRAAIADHDLTAIFFASAPPPTATISGVDQVVDDVTSLFAATQADPVGMATSAMAPPAAAGQAATSGALDWLTTAAPAPGSPTVPADATEADAYDGEPFIDKAIAVPLFTAAGAVDPLAAITELEPVRQDDEPAAAVAAANAAPIQASPEPSPVKAPAAPREPMPALTTPAANANRPKQGKARKRRRHESQPPQTPLVTPVAVDVLIPEWGFFDPQKVGFGPLLARLDQTSSDLRALPRR